MPMNHSYTSLDVASALDFFKVGLVFAAVCLMLAAIRRAYFHPLSKFQGPKFLATTNLIHIWYVLRGQWVHKVLELHEQYGPVVRVAPNEISYISESAWNDIYKTPRGQVQLQKYMPWAPPSWEKGLFENSRDDEHALIRKKVSPVLSDRGVREREPILLQHVSFLIEQLKRAIKAPNSSIVNVVNWYQCVTTDIVGDFLSSEDFQALANSKSHAVLEPNYQELKGLAIGTAFNRNIFTRNVFVKIFRPLQSKTPYSLLAKERFDRRLRTIAEHKTHPPNDTQNPDILSLLTANLSTPPTAKPGLNPSASLPLHPMLARRVTADFILAGTDTVAITLSGATYLLLTNPSTYRKWRDEVRSTFPTAAAINLSGVNALKYQNAVITETLRLWPPGPETTRRVVTAPGGDEKAKGKIICGDFVPEGTLVGVYHWAAGRYSGAWARFAEFRPERWLASTATATAVAGAGGADASNTAGNREEAKESGEGADNAEFANDKRGVMQPYSWGPRNCVGQSLANAELRLILAMMVWWFDLELVQDENQGKWMDVRIFGLVAEKKPLRVRLVERKM